MSLSKGVKIFIPIVLVVVVSLVGIIVYGAVWFDTNYVLMAIERDNKTNVEVCRANKVSCSLLYDSKEDIPEGVLAE